MKRFIKHYLKGLVNKIIECKYIIADTIKIPNNYFDLIYSHGY